MTFPNILSDIQAALSTVRLLTFQHEIRKLAYRGGQGKEALRLYMQSNCIDSFREPTTDYIRSKQSPLTAMDGISTFVSKRCQLRPFVFALLWEELNIFGAIAKVFCIRWRHWRQILKSIIDGWYPEYTDGYKELRHLLVLFIFTVLPEYEGKGIIVDNLSENLTYAPLPP